LAASLSLGPTLVAGSKGSLSGFAYAGGKRDYEVERRAEEANHTFSTHLGTELVFSLQMA
jgi:hypothetical protein